MSQPGSAGVARESPAGARSLGLLVVACLLLLVPSDAGAVSYRLGYRAASPYVDVTLEPARALPGPVILVMPRAIPMGYGEQPYDDFVGDVQAFSDGGGAVAVERAEGPRWTLGGTGVRVARVTYRVDVRGMEATIRSAADASKVRPGYVGLLGYSVFAFLEGFEDEAVHLRIDAPEEWSVFTTLAPAVPAPRGTASAEADGFYALADSQIVLGPEARLLRLEGPVPLYLAVYAEGPVDLDLVGRLVAQTMGEVVAYFGEVPFDAYSVHMELLRPLSEDHEYGFSMEHLASSTYFLEAGRGVTSESPPSDLLRARYNFAHHFVHSWIPKRASGTGYFPFTWELAPVLDSIWFSEGFGQYAAMDAMADAMPEPESQRFRDRLLERRFESSLDEAPLFIRRMPLVELSRVASTRYGQDFRTGKSVFSRGALMAADMDAAIRAATGGEQRLRDALRFLMAWSYENRRPFEIDELPEIFRQATGVDTRSIYHRWLEPPALARKAAVTPESR